jgi:hypothetical protein
MSVRWAAHSSARVRRTLVVHGVVDSAHPLADESRLRHEVVQGSELDLQLLADPPKSFDAGARPGKVA